MHSADTFGRALYDAGAKALCARIDAEERIGHPFIKSNIPAVVDHFAVWLSHRDPGLADPDAKWWRRVRSAYAAEVAGLCKGVIERHLAKGDIGQNMAGAALDAIEEFVSALLLSGDPSWRRDEEWKRERIEIFEAIWSVPRERLGYDADTLLIDMRGRSKP